MKVLFLGTGTSQGIPVLGCKCDVCLSPSKYDKRLRSSIMIFLNEKNLLIDAGPDFRFQMLKYKIDKIDAILITHEHRDHIGGLDEIRALNWIYNKPINIYANEKVINCIKKIYFYAFDENKYPGSPDFNLITIKNEEFFIDDIIITPIQGLHFNTIVFGYRINDFAYLTDIKIITEDELKKLSGVKVLVISALRKEEHISHMNLFQAIEIIKKIKPNIAYLTHIGHSMGKFKDISKYLKEDLKLKNIKIAYDGLFLNI